MQPLLDDGGGRRSCCYRDDCSVGICCTPSGFAANHSTDVACGLSCYSDAVRRHPNALWGDRDVRVALSAHWQHRQQRRADEPPPAYSEIDQPRPASPSLADGWFTCYLSSRCRWERESKTLRHVFDLGSLDVHRHATEREEDDIVAGRLPDRDAARLSTAEILQSLQPVLTAWELEQTLSDLTKAMQASAEGLLLFLLMVTGIVLAVYLPSFLVPLVPGPATVRILVWLSASGIGSSGVIAATIRGLQLSHRCSFFRAIARAQRRLLVEHGVLLELHSWLHYDPAVRAERSKELKWSSDCILATIAIHHGRLVEDFCTQAALALWKGAETPCCPCATELLNPQRANQSAGEELTSTRCCCN